jgi:hypothetical protein
MTGWTLGQRKGPNALLWAAEGQRVFENEAKSMADGLFQHFDDTVKDELAHVILGK